MKNIKNENIYTRRIVTEIRNLLDEIDRMKTAITDYNIQEVQEITKDIIYEMSSRHLEMISILIIIILMWHSSHESFLSKSDKVF